MTNSVSELPGFASEAKKSWHVIYVKARHEKRAYSDLRAFRVEAYLPMRKELHRWSDRHKWVEVPLFSCYVFVKVLPEEFSRVYLTGGFVKFVSSNGRPSIIPDDQIDDIQRVVEYNQSDVEVLEGDYSGLEAEVVTGPLAGLQGEIVDLLNRKSFVIRVDGLEKLLSVNVPVSAVKVLGKAQLEASCPLAIPKSGAISAR